MTIIILIVQSSLNNSASNLPDNTGRAFANSFSSQSGAASSVYHQTGQWDCRFSVSDFLVFQNFSSSELFFSSVRYRKSSGPAQHSWKFQCSQHAGHTWVKDHNNKQYFVK